MYTNFIPGWISCLDESMIIWKNKFGPVWVVLPRKPHPFGNEWHIICCAKSVMVFLVDLVEGNDLPKERGNPEFKSDYIATGVVMMRKTKPHFGTGKDVVADSGFCVLKGLVGMLAHGVYRTTMAKKKDIGPSTAGEIPLRNSYETSRLGIFILFVVICMGKSTRYSV